MKTAFVRGLGLWTPGFRDPVSWCRTDHDPEALTPEAELLTGALRRRASTLTRMSTEVLQQAVGQAGCDPSKIPSVWATAHGEHGAASAILGMMHRGEGKVSPTHFHNSVYNTASGYASIATNNRAPSTTLTGGRDLVAITFLEAFCHLEAGAPDVALVMADEPLQPPFEVTQTCVPLAVSFCLSARPDGAQAAVSNLRRDAIAPVKRHERFGDLYVAAALPLLEQIVLGRPGPTALEMEGLGEGLAWCVDLELVDHRDRAP